MDGTSYKFMDWRKAFDHFRKEEKENPGENQLVISTHWATSGYWVEPKHEPATDNFIVVDSENIDPRISEPDIDIIYRGEEARLLMLRVVHTLFIAKLSKRVHVGLIV